tara:strand:- start:1421 stop:2386 length:966 start_codon:yes stop_codon:yes gene_type:complete
VFLTLNFYKLRQESFMYSLVLILCSLVVVGVYADADQTNIIYGQDNRRDIKELDSVEIKKLGKSIAGRVLNFSFQVSTIDNKISFNNVPTLSSSNSMKVCSGQRFAEQKTAADCTGFLVGEDLLVTAGHCMMGMGQRVSNRVTRQCRSFSWMFDYTSESDLNNVSLDSVYGCESVIAGEFSATKDYALIKLERKVKNRTPLKLSQSKASLGQKIFVMGHPSGLPLKYADGARVFETENDYFSTNLDTFGGNSGSPVFNADTLEVEGILVRGDTDYVMDFESNGERCMKVNICDQERENCLEDDPNILGEHVNYIDIINSNL